MTRIIRMIAGKN